MDGPEDNQANPFSWVDDFHDESIENRFLANLSLKYKLPIRGLNYELRIGGNKEIKNVEDSMGLQPSKVKQISVYYRYLRLINYPIK